MPKQPALLLCLLTIITAPAQAADCKPDSPTQTDLNICAGNAFKAANAEMSSRYEKIVACLKDGAKPLVEAQQVWRKFRDAECMFRAGPREDGGSAWPMAFDGCLQTMTEKRSKELNYYLTCAEGDLTCPTYACGFHKTGQAPR